MNKKIIIFAIVFFIFAGRIYSQDPFSRGYYEKVSTYNNQYTRKQMFDIYEMWLNDAVDLAFDKIQYDYTVYTQRDKQNYAWTIERGTSGYSNSYSIFHWIKIYISNGEFTIYYPSEGTSVSGYRRFIASSGADWNSEIRYTLNSFVDQSKKTLAIYNDNYGAESLRQLSGWVDMLLNNFSIIAFGHVLAGRSSPFAKR